METRIPPRFKTFHERACVSPPCVSKTASTSHFVFETDRCIIDRFVRAQFFEISLISLRGRSDDMDSLGMRELYGESAHAAGRAVDKHLLARF